MPDAYKSVTRGIMANQGLTETTKDIMVNDVCKSLADNLQSSARMKALGEDSVHVVTIITLFPPLPADEIMKMCDFLNVWMAGATADNHQLIGIASIPPPPLLAKAGPPYIERGLNILRRAIIELGLKGVLFTSNYNSVFLGDSAFDPYFALIEELGVPIIIHPAVQPVEEQFIPWKNIGALSGFLNDQRTTILDLVMAGVLEKYPNLKIIATHLGGGILSSLGRFRTVSTRFPHELWYIDLDGNRHLLPQAIENYVKKIYFDCNNADVEDIAHAISKVGVDHLVTGTDIPWTDDRFTRRVLGELGDDGTRAKLAYNNAAKLFLRNGISYDLQNRPLL